jgi:peptidoglycan/xylan/chitin deacetylase (PgdA/CDA1 family)
MKLIIQKHILPALVNLNVESIFPLMANGKMLNIFYHGVVNSDSIHILPRHMIKEQFEQHMKYLSKKFNVISIDEAFSLYHQNIKPDKKTVTVSFDDGYVNNLESALPIIEKYKIKTTFFVSGICSEDDTHIMWPDVIAFANYFSNTNYLLIGEQKFFRKGRYNLINPENNISIYDYIKELSYAERIVVLKEITDRYELKTNIKDLPREWWKLMNREEIKQLSSSSLVSIGSHGHLHYNLANISYKDAKAEMEMSKNILSEITGKKINLMSFPDGSYNDEVKEIALSLGYDGLLAVDYRCPSDLQDKNILNRWGVSSTTTFETIAFSLNKAFIKNAF